MFFLTEDLITSVSRRTLAPTSQQTFQTTDIIAIANERMQIDLVPRIMAVRENFFLASKRVALTSGLNHYAIPERAIGNALKAVFYVDSNGKRIWPALSQRQVSSMTDSTQSGPQPIFFELIGDEIWVEPTPSQSAGYLEFWYYQRPNKLVSTSSCAKITSVSSAGGTTTFTVNTDLSGSLSIGSLVDCVEMTSPFRLVGKDVAITAITSSTIAVATSAVSDEVGNVLPGLNDYICAAQAANIPMIPQELHVVLAQECAITILEALGDMQKLAAAKQTLAEMSLAAFKLIENRVENAAPVIFNRRGISSYSMLNTLPVPARSS